eukprot:jgi/Tetstr1/430865/TSEL_002007.t1
MHTALKNLWASAEIGAGAVLDRDRSGAGDLTLETSGLRPADRSRPSDLTLAGWGGGPACDYMIDFACVSSTTSTWSNDPRWCTPGIAATEAEHGKLAADRASSAPVQGVHRYYPFVVEDRGRLGKSALTVVYIFAVLLAVRNFPGAQGGRVGAKSVRDEDDYLAVPELLSRAESGYEAVRPVSRVHGLFPLSTDLTNEYLKQDDRRLPAQEEYLWMSCFGAHIAALFVALDELLPYVPAANQDFTPYLARGRNHAEAIDKAFRFRLAFLRRLNEIKRVHGDQGVLDNAGVDVGVTAGAGVPAKVSTSDGVGRLSSELLALCEATFRRYEREGRAGRPSYLNLAPQTRTDAVANPFSNYRPTAGNLAAATEYFANSSRTSGTLSTLNSYAGKLSQFAEFCHDSENISPLEATTATVIRYVAWVGERGHIGAKSLQPCLSAINTFFELQNLDPIAKDSLHLAAARRGLMLRQRRLEAAPLRVPLPADVAYRFVTKAELIVIAPIPEYQ